MIKKGRPRGRPFCFGGDAAPAVDLPDSAEGRDNFGKGQGCAFGRKALELCLIALHNDFGHYVDGSEIS
jgi:hypothetical protein